MSRLDKILQSDVFSRSTCNSFVMRRTFFFANKYRIEYTVISFETLLVQRETYGDQRFAAESASHRSQNQKLLTEFSSAFTKEHQVRFARKISYCSVEIRQTYNFPPAIKPSN